jgi:hypothetical protein
MVVESIVACMNTLGSSGKLLNKMQFNWFIKAESWQSLLKKKSLSI